MQESNRTKSSPPSGSMSKDSSPRWESDRRPKGSVTAEESTQSQEEEAVRRVSALLLRQLHGQ